MKTEDIIKQHLKPDWLTELPDSETLRVLLDRIMDEEGVEINAAVLRFWREAEFAAASLNWRVLSPKASDNLTRARLFMLREDWCAARSMLSFVDELEPLRGVLDLIKSVMRDLGRERELNADT